MQFECPHCGASYKVKDTSRLREAGGRVLCYRCDTEFEVPDLKPEPPGQPAGTTADEAAPASPPVDVDVDVDVDEVAATVEPDAATETEPQPPPESETEPMPDVIEDYTDHAERLAQHFGEAAAPAVADRHWLWGTGAAVLLLVLVGQLLWTFQTRPGVYAFLQSGCELFGCEFTPPRLPEAFRLTDRVFTRDAEHPDVLTLKLRVANNVDFTQPLPVIELVLFDTAQAVVGKSRVRPGEYLPPGSRNIIGPGEIGEVQLHILDPGQAATGFAIKFL